MKRMIALAIVTVMLAMLMVPALADSSEYSFIVMANGEDRLTVAPGSEITITLKIAKADKENITLYSMQDYICFDPEYLEFVEGSIDVGGINKIVSNATPIKFSVIPIEKYNRVYVNRTGATASNIPSGTVLLSFKLKALKEGTTQLFQDAIEMFRKVGELESAEGNSLEVIISSGASPEPSNPSNPTDPVPHGGSGGASLPSELIDIPVFGDENSVSAAVSVEETTAVIENTDIGDVISAAAETGTVVFDLVSLKDINAVAIPKEMIRAISEAVSDKNNDADGLEIRLPAGTVSFNERAVGAITSQLAGDMLLTLEEIGTDKLNSAQKKSADSLEVLKVLNAFITIDGKRVGDFHGGKATVTVENKLDADKMPKGVGVYYSAENGTLTEVPSKADMNSVSFTVEHFSKYIITYDAKRAEECKRDDTCPISTFTDANPKAWYHDGVHFVLENKLMSGYGDGIFAPDDNTSRAMVAMILWNMEGRPSSNYQLAFSDVNAGAWYAEAVRWAAENGIVKGYSEDIFAPDDNITREQLSAILYRYAQKNGEGFKGAWMFKLDYSDAANVSDWAYESVCWMTMNGIVNGYTDGRFAPGDKATRAQIATMVMRFCTLES